jgi:hypothetical protein
MNLGTGRLHLDNFGVRVLGLLLAASFTSITVTMPLNTSSHLFAPFLHSTHHPLY